MPSGVLQPNFTYWSSAKPPVFGGPAKILGFCSIGDDLVLMGSSEHNSSYFSTYPFGEYIVGSNCPSDKHHKEIPETVIGFDVWIGNHVTIMGGVKVGHGSIIGAYSVVSKDVLPYSVVAGNPARFKKWRFTEDVREFLLRIEWWNWEKDMIKEAAPILMSSDFEKLREFVAKYNLGGNHGM
jgi:acetyltransferase-like isoleucine patch superfamily enzyme